MIITFDQIIVPVGCKINHNLYPSRNINENCYYDTISLAGYTQISQMWFVRKNIPWNKWNMYTTSWWHSFDFLFKTFFFFLLLLKYHFSNWTNYSYAKVIVFAESLRIFNIISLSLFGWFSNYEGQLSSLFLQIAFLTVRVEVTLPWLVLCRDPLYSVPRTLQFLFFFFSFYLWVPWENGLFSVDPCQKLISGGRVITVIVRLSCLYRLVKYSIQWGRWIVYSLGDYIVVLIHLEPRFLFRGVNVR